MAAKSKLTTPMVKSVARKPQQACANLRADKLQTFKKNTTVFPHLGVAVTRLATVLHVRPIFHAVAAENDEVLLLVDRSLAKLKRSNYLRGT